MGSATFRLPPGADPKILGIPVNPDGTVTVSDEDMARILGTDTKPCPVRKARFVPLPISISAAQIAAGLAEAVEKLSVEVSLGGVRRMLVDAAGQVAKTRDDQDQLLAAIGRLVDHLEASHG